MLESCQDWYEVYPDGSVIDPQGPASGSLRVIRGGYWLNHAGVCRSAYRNYILPDSRYASLGFRVFLTRDE